MSGQGTAGGMNFQAHVGARIAAHILAEKPLVDLNLSLERAGVPLKIKVETGSYIDDIEVETDKGTVFIQAKTTLHLSSSETSELRKVAKQFVGAYLSQPEAARSGRALFVLAVGRRCSGTIAIDLHDWLNRQRTEAISFVSEKQGKAEEVFAEHLEAVWQDVRDEAIPNEDLIALLQAIHVVVCDEYSVGNCLSLLEACGYRRDKETAAFTLLGQWVAERCGEGTGGDRRQIDAYLRSELGMERWAANIGGQAHQDSNWSAIRAIPAARERQQQAADALGLRPLVRPARGILKHLAFALIPPGVFRCDTPGRRKSMPVGRPSREVRFEAPFAISVQPITESWCREHMADVALVFQYEQGLLTLKHGMVAEFLAAVTQAGDAKPRLPSEAEWQYCMLGCGDRLKDDGRRHIGAKACLGYTNGFSIHALEAGFKEWVADDWTDSADSLPRTAAPFRGETGAPGIRCSLDQHGGAAASRGGAGVPAAVRLVLGENDLRCMDILRD